MPPIASVRLVKRDYSGLVSLAAAATFAAFIVSKGIPTLRHDWSWPTDRGAVASFMSSSLDGWLSSGLGAANPHPTTYLIALPIGAAMWLFGPLTALALLSVTIGYACMRSSATAAAYWSSSWCGAIGVGLFALFNPWVYNEVVAGHLVMVLAYAGLIGLFAEMLRGSNASPVRLALWTALIEAQLQFFILAILALIVFATTTRKWLPPLLGVVVALPSAIGLIAERGVLLQIPYGVTWQTNQSVLPLPLLALGGYFAGYADRLGSVAVTAVCAVLALAVVGFIAARRHEAVIWSFVVAAIVYIIVLGVHGPLAIPYAWIVRNVPESGVFRELYDLAGAFAAFLALLAAAATGRLRALGYVALLAGIVLPCTWLFDPPGDLWVSSNAYPHPAISAPPFTRIALLPAFQPLGLRDDGGDGADPDAYVYPHHVPTLNEYFPGYPVDMALARYEQFGDVAGLRALGVGEIVSRPWLVSRMHGGIGFAASSLQPRTPPHAFSKVRYLEDTMPLFAQCPATRVVTFDNRLGACDLFFGDLETYAPIHAVVAPADSIDPQTAWIDARLAFAESPALAQALGGALTQSDVPYAVQPNLWLLAYVRGALVGGGRDLVRNRGAFVWARIPSDVSSVRCAGLCELVAQSAQLPSEPTALPSPAHALQFHAHAPWLYFVDGQAGIAANSLLRFNERYDPGWVAFQGGHPLRHVRVDAAVNGWFFERAFDGVVLVQTTAALQLIAEIVGVCCVLSLLKALLQVPTKRAP